MSSSSRKGKSKSLPAPKVQRIRVENVHRAPAFLKVEALSSDGRRVRHRVVKVSGLSPTKKRVDSGGGPISVPAFDSVMMDIEEERDNWVLGGQGLFVSAGVDAADVELNDNGLGGNKDVRSKSEADLRWNGSFFENTSLKELGLVIQLGHDEGGPCALREMARTGFVVVDVDSIQEVSIAYCACRSAEVVGVKWQQLMRRELYPGSVDYPYTAFTFRVLALFHALTLKGKINLYDFYYGLEMRSNGGGCRDIKDRYDSFRKVTRQWRYLKMLKRGGLGNDQTRRLEDIRPGELAVRCIACPQPGVNLPLGWQSVPEDQRFLYNKFLSLDACFRLKRRAISSEAADPGLLTGLAYYVDQEPYQRWMKAAPDQKETNDCSSLAAVKQANTKFNRGYATTGCLLCMCSRHELCEPNGVVDLNRGEKFLLGDYALGASQRLSSPLLKRVLSYDIACQYCKKFFTRMRSLPEEAAVEMDDEKWSFVVPKLHIRGHERPCQETYALHLHPGAGQTDGEGIERLWAEVGPVGISTREMGPGHRRDTLDDHQGARNWRKICGLGFLLRRREAEARRQVVVHTAEYERFCQSQPVSRVEEWRRKVVEWESGKSTVNPYSLSERGETEEDVRLRLAVQEAERSLRGEPILHEVAPSAFLLMGLDIEDQQRRMAINLADKEEGTVREKTEVVEKRAKLGRLIARFRSLQQIYTPTALAYLTTLPNYSNTSMEESLRTHLFVRAGLNIERTTQARGQKGSTRSRQDIASNETDIVAFKTKYRAAWNALLVLIGEERLQQQMPGYQSLQDHDVRSHEDQDSYCTITSRKARPVTESRPLLVPGESRRSLSWIWTGVDVTGDSKAMQEALRIEWSKCWARKRRWDEELALILEEKRRAVVSLEFEADRWRKVAEEGRNTSPEGYTAYALRQAAVREGLVQKFRSVWSTPIRQRKRVNRGVVHVGDITDGEDEGGEDGASEDERLRMELDEEEDEEEDD
ncbi:hypothetical protein VNI00_018964 [Paramarasmius palmivorus]|uniref:CxC2-like cysteine cluster KDZ transposase-associated domain-containing protein n=1 Tax=Paramarasmius palmivorus TaxID=297713 RepID=A0AAW0ASS4_9AGAR